MNSKQIWTFFIAFCLVKNGANGCVNQELIEDFNAVDLDSNGVLDRDEICQNIQDTSACGEVMNDYDLNGNGTVTCQGICYTLCTVFENHRKSLIQHCERSELRLHFEWTKSN